MLPSVEACKSAERTINANEWKRGEMERKRANMFVLDLTIDTFQNIAGNTLIHIFKRSQKLGAVLKPISAVYMYTHIQWRVSRKNIVIIPYMFESLSLPGQQKDSGAAGLFSLVDASK